MNTWTLERLEYGKFCVEPDGSVEEGRHGPIEHGFLGWSAAFPNPQASCWRLGKLGPAPEDGWPSGWQRRGSVLLPLCFDDGLRQVYIQQGERPEGRFTRPYTLARFSTTRQILSLDAPESLPSPLSWFSAIGQKPLRGLTRAQAATLEPDPMQILPPVREEEDFLREALTWIVSGVPVVLAAQPEVVSERQLYVYAEALWWHIPAALRPFFGAGWNVAGRHVGRLPLCSSLQETTQAATYDPVRKRWTAPSQVLHPLSGPQQVRAELLEAWRKPGLVWREWQAAAQSHIRRSSVGPVVGGFYQELSNQGESVLDLQLPAVVGLFRQAGWRAQVALSLERLQAWLERGVPDPSLVPQVDLVDVDGLWEAARLAVAAYQAPEQVARATAVLWQVRKLSKGQEILPDEIPEEPRRVDKWIQASQRCLQPGAHISALIDSLNGLLALEELRPCVLPGTAPSSLQQSLINILDQSLMLSPAKLKTTVGKTLREQHERLLAETLATPSPMLLHDWSRSASFRLVALLDQNVSGFRKRASQLLQAAALLDPEGQDRVWREALRGFLGSEIPSAVLFKLSAPEQAAIVSITLIHLREALDLGGSAPVEDRALLSLPTELAGVEVPESDGSTTVEEDWALLLSMPETSELARVLKGEPLIRVLRALATGQNPSLQAEEWKGVAEAICQGIFPGQGSSRFQELEEKLSRFCLRFWSDLLPHYLRDPAPRWERLLQMWPPLLAHLLTQKRLRFPEGASLEVALNQIPRLLTAQVEDIASRCLPSLPEWPTTPRLAAISSVLWGLARSARDGDLSKDKCVAGLRTLQTQRFPAPLAHASLRHLVTIVRALPGKEGEQARSLLKKQWKEVKNLPQLQMIMMVLPSEQLGPLPLGHALMLFQMGKSPDQRQSLDQWLQDPLLEGNGWAPQVRWLIEGKFQNKELQYRKKPWTDTFSSTHLALLFCGVPENCQPQEGPALWGQLFHDTLPTELARRYLEANPIISRARLKALVVFAIPDRPWEEESLTINDLLDRWEELDQRGIRPWEWLYQLVYGLRIILIFAILLVFVLLLIYSIHQSMVLNKEFVALLSYWAVWALSLLAPLVLYRLEQLDLFTYRTINFQSDRKKLLKQIANKWRASKK